MDANSNGIILAWGILKSGSIASWTWFLKNLSQAIPSILQAGVIVLSDRDKGLEQATHSTRFTPAAQDIFQFRIAQATNPEKFEEGMTVLAEQNAAAAAYSMNKVLVEDRSLPPVEMLNSNWTREMGKRFDRKTEIDRIYQPEDFLTIKSGELFRAAEARSGHTGITPANLNSGVVRDLTGISFNVDLVEGFCSCRWYQENGLPRGHAIAFCHCLGIAPRGLIPFNVTLENYKQMY
ncbi:MAG: hypothetical protein M1829_003201 [Trizodia sp. TS-e1964]|nr:MAG: hypothetical protein M1829_003201 [Trizodia sp. TS-e1964]